MPKQRPTILLVDPDEGSTARVAELFALYNYQVIGAASREEALEVASQAALDSVIIALEVPGGGFELSQEIRALDGCEDLPTAFVTSEDRDYALLMEAQFYGGLFLHGKPYDEVELLAQISTMVRINLLEDELKQRMAELDRLASTDPLTGLYNRRLFFKRLDEELARVQRKPFPICLIYIDIDHFKQVNDTHGHLAGDAVLQQLSTIMTRLLRRSDVLGRIGGEEFLIMLPDTTGEAGQQIAERLRKRVEQATFVCQKQKISLTISAGVFYATDPVVLSADDLVRLADEALYRAKQEGRNRVVYHKV